MTVLSTVKLGAMAVCANFIDASATKLSSVMHKQIVKQIQDSEQVEQNSLFDKQELKQLDELYGQVWPPLYSGNSESFLTQIKTYIEDKKKGIAERSAMAYKTEQTRAVAKLKRKLTAFVDENFDLLPSEKKNSFFEKEKIVRGQEMTWSTSKKDALRGIDNDLKKQKDQQEEDRQAFCVYQLHKEVLRFMLQEIPKNQHTHTGDLKCQTYRTWRELLKSATTAATCNLCMGKPLTEQTKYPCADEACQSICNDCAEKIRDNKNNRCPLCRKPYENDQEKRETTWFYFFWNMDVNVTFLDISTKKPLDGNWCWKYMGEWFGDKRHGRGRQVFADGSIYDGSWVYDEKRVEARRENDNHESMGAGWDMGQPNGQGVRTEGCLDPGRQYEGQWKDGNRHGQGAFTRTGYWSDDMGEVTLTLNGWWEDNKFDYGTGKIDIKTPVLLFGIPVTYSEKKFMFEWRFDEAPKVTKWGKRHRIDDATSDDAGEVYRWLLIHVK